MSRLLLFATVVPCLLIAGVAAATATATHRCSTVAEPQARLACYDAEFPPMDDGGRAAGVEVGQQKAHEEFGLNRSQLRERQPEPLRQPLPKRLEAVVTRVSERVVTLDNGQVWLLTEAISKGHLEAGDAVSIKSAAMGTFLLITPARAALRVRRVE